MVDDLEPQPDGSTQPVAQDDPPEVVDGVISETVRDEVRHLFRSEISQDIKHQVTASVSPSPVPADDLVKLNEAHPGTIEWALQYMDREQSFRHEINNRAADYDFKKLDGETKGKNEARRLMAAIILAVFVASVVLIATGKSVEGLIGVLFALGSLTGVYVYGQIRGDSGAASIQRRIAEMADEVEEAPPSPPNSPNADG